MTLHFLLFIATAYHGAVCSIRFLNQFIVCASFYNLTFIEYAYFICILIVDNRWAIAIVVRVS